MLKSRMQTTLETMKITSLRAQIAARSCRNSMPDLTVLTEKRLEMLESLEEKPKTEATVVNETNLNASTVTRGLRDMEESEFVEKLTEINGIEMAQNIYKLTDGGKRALDVHNDQNSGDGA